MMIVTLISIIMKFLQDMSVANGITVMKNYKLRSKKKLKL
jgi:hypothetical protein